MTSKKAGRPEETFKVNMKDPVVSQQVELFGRLAATHNEMAAWFECTVRTIERYMADQSGDFCRVYRKAEAEANQSLRRMQFKAADSGNATMLIWLGKQRLGQKDVQRQELVGDEDKPLNVSVDLNTASKTVKNILDGIED